MTAGCQILIRYDSDGSPTIEVRLPGFHSTWAYPTGLEEASFWEFDLTSIDGFEMHCAIPYTLSTDLLETLFVRAAKNFQEGMA